MDRNRWSTRHEIRVEVGLEFVQQDLELTIVQASGSGDVGGIDDRGTLRFHVRDGGVNQRIRGRAVPEVPLPRDSNARPLQPVTF